MTLMATPALKQAGDGRAVTDDIHRRLEDLSKIADRVFQPIDLKTLEQIDEDNWIYLPQTEVLVAAVHGNSEGPDGGGRNDFRPGGMFIYNGLLS